MDRWNTRPPSGESYADVNCRVSEWYKEVEFAKTTLVICHGLTSRVLRGIYMGLTHQEVLVLQNHMMVFQTQPWNCFLYNLVTRLMFAL